MRILYGVVGEGMGHAIRSRVVIDHLVKNHEVCVVVSGRAHDYIKQRVSERLRVEEIWGLTIVYEDNEVRNFKTLLRNVKGAVAGGWPKNVKAYFKVVDDFEPEVVITDFESWSYFYALNHLLPIFSVDNMQVINRCKHPRALLKGHRTDFELSRAIVKVKAPGCNHYLITTFFEALIRKRRTTLHPPILRPAILDAKSEQGDHILVYQTSDSHARLPEILEATGAKCRIYGLRRGLAEDVVEGNLRYRPFSDDGFIEDLRTARAVIAGGGFTLMGEAVYLHKPMLSVPVEGQFEQVLNARYLESEGYGLYAEEITADRVAELLERLPEFETNLRSYRQDGNRELFTHLDELLDQQAARATPPPALLKNKAPDE